MDITSMLVPVQFTDLNQKWQEIYMYIETELSCGTKAAIVVREAAEKRLNELHFRGRDQVLAGNFSAWESLEILFAEDGTVRHELLDELCECCNADEFGTRSVEIECPFVVGWSSTDDSTLYQSDDLEEFTPNRRSSALRVRPESSHLKSPQTSYVTIVFELKCEDDKIVAVVHSLYPGKDVGNLDGNVTEREGQVFFDWNHPGQH